MNQKSLINEGDTRYAAQFVRQQIMNLVASRGDVGATRQEIIRSIRRQPVYVGQRIDECVAGGELVLTGGVYLKG